MRELRETFAGFHVLTPKIIKNPYIDLWIDSLVLISTRARTRVYQSMHVLAYAYSPLQFLDPQ